MAQRVIYRNPDNTIGIIVPAPNSTLTINQIADKDVPTGLAYVIVDETAIPADRTYRDAWDINPAELIDGIGA